MPACDDVIGAADAIARVLRMGAGAHDAGP
jgi:hypothetical protein